MRRSVLLAFVLPFAACHDFEGGSSLSTGPTPRINYPVAASWARLSPDTKRAVRATLEEVYAEQGLSPLRGQIAISDAELPQAAAAIIVNHPETPEQPILVLSASNLNDEVIVQAIMAYAEEGAAGYRHDSARWILVKPQTAHLQGGLQAVSSSRRSGVRTTLAGRLWQDATSVNGMVIPGIGPVRLFRFD